MKQDNIIIIVFLILLSFTSCKDVEKSYYPDGALECEIEGKDGIRNGVSKCYYPNGKVKIEGVCKDDKEQGEFREYYESGSLWGVYNYEKGLLEGSYIEYYEDGNIKSEMTYKNNELNGVANFYYKNGKISMESYSENNQTLYYTKYDSLGNWIDEYRFVKVTCPDTVLFGEEYQITLELSGPPISLKDSVLLAFGVFLIDVNENQLPEELENEVLVVDSNRITFTYVAKKIGKLEYTGQFATNRFNKRRKGHDILQDNIYVIDEESKLEGRIR